METLLEVLSGTLLWQLTWVGSQHLEQSPQALIIKEREDVTISCNSSKTLYSVHWYRQKHAEGPIFLMMLLNGGEEKSHDKITTMFNEKKQLSFLYIRASQLSHSGTYFCAAETQQYIGFQRLHSNLTLDLRCSPGTGPLWNPNQRSIQEKKGVQLLQHNWVSSQELLQSPPSLSIPEGENLTISCNSSTTLYALHWYRQKCDGEFVFLMLFRKGGEEKRHEKLTATLDVKMQQSSLSITAAQPSHSGTYFCGGEAQ
ncbi:uncharacterized protein LOC124976548 [Sciurus carolinensis]|uniref:uncharacterized protein LOC124976548 n=1 Tax=Sciurus carolinensis TaxID=30640 RepID=UPI001FB2E7BB|nr:uncharacterized protein LOC124976548 [Sciurus carolinensis]